MSVALTVLTVLVGVIAALALAEADSARGRARRRPLAFPAPPGPVACGLRPNRAHPNRKWRDGARRETTTASRAEPRDPKPRADWSPAPRADGGERPIVLCHVDGHVMSPWFETGGGMWRSECLRCCDYVELRARTRGWTW